MEKCIKKNFIDAEYFYQFNQKFFALAFMFELFTAMSFNSCSDIPCLFILLILAAFYGQRKQYSRAYRQGSFFVVYFIMFMLVLKLINDILNRIPFIKDFMKYNKASMIV